MDIYMKVAVDEARKGIKKGHGGPFGSCVVKDGKIIAKGHNEVLLKHDCTCHGEIETIKKSEDDKSILLRIYEGFGRKTRVQLTFGLDVKNVYLCNMLEDRTSNVTVARNAVELELQPYEIITLEIGE